MAAQNIITLKESNIGKLISSMEGRMTSKFYLSFKDENVPFIDIARKRKLMGWEVTRLPELLWKATKEVEGKIITLRHYYVTGEWVVNFDGDCKEYEYDNALQAKRMIRRWLTTK